MSVLVSTSRLRLAVALLVLPVLMPAQSEAEDASVDLEAKLLHAQPNRSQARLRSFATDGASIVEVKGGTGIGWAEVRRVGSEWPNQVVLRLHLQGLETLQIQYFQNKAKWSAISTAGGRTLMSVSQAGSWARIERSDPRFTALRLVGDNPTVPLRNGYFELSVPAFVFARNPSALTLHWVDFYR